METKIDITKDFTMQDIASKEFVLFVRDFIKEIEEDQKIAKRDRKFAKHPCEANRKYSCSQAVERVWSNRNKLCYLYEIYYFMKKNKDYDWSTIKLEYKKTWRGMELHLTELKRSELKEKGCKLLNNASLSFGFLKDVIKKYVGYGDK